MSIVLSGKSQKYIRKNNIQHLLIDLTFIEEPCTEIYDPIIKILRERDLDRYRELDKISEGNLNLYISKNFVKTFGNHDNYSIDTSGIFRNKLVLKNVDPIIVNTCKTN
ncbi:MAG: hypothetical protein ACW972_01000 [Promethearchaeota archaeon]|jgi:hypothetical protein